MKKTITIVSVFFAFATQAQVGPEVMVYEQYDEVPTQTIPSETEDPGEDDVDEGTEFISFETITANQVAALDAAVPLGTDLKNGIYGMLIYKNERLANPNLTEPQKAAISETFREDLLGVLSESQRNTLLLHPEVIANVIQ